ncbi:MAG TPA: sulfotransferase [Solirubrobacteraceae bacterium]|nr:sulfotransferase [Solirubrobacteraceae bacterium]
MEGGGKTKVVYIMGTGRSGSTILGITLGNCPDLFYAGELHLWIGKGGKAPLGGEHRQRFWEAVRAGVNADLSGPEARSLERSTSVIRLGGRRARAELRRRYRRLAEQLFASIAQEARSAYVVDSSHFPRRARELQQVPSIELYLLFLVRDPQGIVSSYSGDDAVFPGFNLLTTNLYIWLTYLLSTLVFLRHPRARRLLVSYDAFAASPEGVLKEILACIGSPATMPPDLQKLQTGLMFQGNPVAKSDVVAFRASAAGPRSRSLLTTVLQLPWTAAFSMIRPASRSSRAPDGGAA